MKNEKANPNKATLRQDFSDSSRSEPSAVTKKTNRKSSKSPSPITLRVTDEERQRLKVLSAGQPISAYIRQCVFGSSGATRPRARYTPTIDQRALARLLALLGQSRIANNLNQLAHQANIGALSINDEALDQIVEAYRHVQEIRTVLITALGLSDTSPP